MFQFNISVKIPKRKTVGAWIVPVRVHVDSGVYRAAVGKEPKDGGAIPNMDTPPEISTE